MNFTVAEKARLILNNRFFIVRLILFFIGCKNYGYIFCIVFYSFDYYRVEIKKAYILIIVVLGKYFR